MHDSLILTRNFFLIFTGEGVVEMASDEVSCSASDGEASVLIKRSDFPAANSFPVEVTWRTKDNDAVYQKHYKTNQGI